MGVSIYNNQIMTYFCVKNSINLVIWITKLYKNAIINIEIDSIFGKLKQRLYIISGSL